MALALNEGCQDRSRHLVLSPPAEESGAYADSAECSSNDLPIYFIEGARIRGPGARCRSAQVKKQGGLIQMIRRIALLIVVSAIVFVAGSESCQAQQAYGRSWGASRPSHDWDRFYHYPYVYYPQNYWTDQYYRSSNSLYYRYPAEMRIPVYNKKWHNYYPSCRLYHSGHHFQLDVF